MKAWSRCHIYSKKYKHAERAVHLDRYPLPISWQVSVRPALHTKFKKPADQISAGFELYMAST